VTNVAPVGPYRREVPLHEVLRGALGAVPAGVPDATVTGVAQRADKVRPGAVFVARVGAVVDGHEFVAEAVARGAVCVVGTRAEVAGLPVPYVRVADDRRATSALAAAFHGHPSASLTVAGVTGTDGKTTTSTLLHHLVQGDGGHPVASLLSSALARIGRAPYATEGHFTTPEATEVQEHLATARDAGVRVAVLESSSHGVSLQRLADVRYALMVWTNLSPEHLDHHGSYAAYRAAKAGLVARAGIAILNRDDPEYAHFAAVAPRLQTTYGRHPEADVRAEDVIAGAAGLAFTLVAEGERRPATLPMVGDFNVSNALAALAAARALGVAFEPAVARLARFPGVPGRMQLVATAPCSVVVDFAHTPDALAKALAALTPGRGGRRIVVVGAAGERDPNKRAPLGAVAVRGADLAIFTEEDHRTEELADILARMVEGARGAGAAEGEAFVVVPDRRDAIREALRRAGPSDVVVLAGKGHERTLERGHVALPWDEAAEARAAAAAIAGPPAAPRASDA
jgi:UDP-N-acetylmuramoyl-L-alanyl-D-glutamate--2,6-diaminopimelate ligase